MTRKVKKNGWAVQIPSKKKIQSTIPTSIHFLPYVFLGRGAAVPAAAPPTGGGCTGENYFHVKYLCLHLLKSLYYCGLVSFKNNLKPLFVFSRRIACVLFVDVGWKSTGVERCAQRCLCLNMCLAALASAPVTHSSQENNKKTVHRETNTFIKMKGWALCVTLMKFKCVCPKRV